MKHFFLLLFLTTLLSLVGFSQDTLINYHANDYYKEKYRNLIPDALSKSGFFNAKQWFSDECIVIPIRKIRLGKESKEENNFLYMEDPKELILFIKTSDPKLLHLRSYHIKDDSIRVLKKSREYFYKELWENGFFRKDLENNKACFVYFFEHEKNFQNMVLGRRDGKIMLYDEGMPLPGHITWLINRNYGGYNTFKELIKLDRCNEEEFGLKAQNEKLYLNGTMDYDRSRDIDPTIRIRLR